MNDNNELKHYGVPGMRWGVRRAKKQYAKATTKEQRDKLDARMRSHRAKAVKQVKKLERKYPELERKVERSIQKTDVKAAKLEREATRTRRAAYGHFQTAEKAQRRLYQADKKAARAAELRALSADAKAKLASNKDMQRLFNKGINEIDALLVDKGKTLTGYNTKINKAKSDLKSGKITGKESRRIVKDTKRNRKNYLNAI